MNASGPRSPGPVKSVASSLRQASKTSSPRSFPIPALASRRLGDSRSDSAEVNAHDWFSQDELLAELSRVGITLPERTLRFWVANGVLSAPIKKPYRGADGRVGYFPREALTLVPEILRLQSEGWKLRQSKARLAQTQDLPKTTKPAAQEPSDGGQEWATRYLQDLLSDTESRDRRRCFASPAAPNSELRQVRHYLVARLERWVGRSAAVRATSAFLLSLSRRDFQRLVSRLKIPSSVRLVQALVEKEPESNSEIRLPPESSFPSVLADIESQRVKLQKAKSAGVPPVLWERTLSCLEQLETLMKSRPLQEDAMRKTLSRLQEIEAQASADLAFLQEHTEGATREDPKADP